MDDAFYNDLRKPFTVVDIGSGVTLSTTDKALYPAGNFPVLGGNYWWVGKKIKIRLFGRITTAATPGNLTWSIYWGTGGDANGTVLAASAAEALTANQTNLSWMAEFFIHCRSIGAAGTLFVTGMALFNESVKAVRQLIPASAPAVSSAVDLTAASIVSVQVKRSGSTAETMQVHDMEVTALN